MVMETVMLDDESVIHFLYPPPEYVGLIKSNLLHVFLPYLFYFPPLLVREIYDFNVVFYSFFFLQFLERMMSVFKK